MAHAQKPDFAFRGNGLVHLNRRGRQFSRLLAAEVCASAVVMLDTSCSEVLHSIRQFPLHFPSLVSPCAITFQLESTVEEEFSCFLGTGVFGTVFTELRHWIVVLLGAIWIQSTCSHPIYCIRVLVLPCQPGRRSNHYFLGPFAKLPRATNLLCSACLSVRMEQLGSHWMDFHEIWYQYFSKLCRENSSFVEILQE